MKAAVSKGGRLTAAFFRFIKDAGMQVRCLLCMRQIFFTKGRIMTGKTHAAVGLGTVLAVTQPSTVSGLVLAAGTGNAWSTDQ